MPTALKIKRGETRPGQLNHTEPLPRPNAPQPPADMDDEAKAVWERVLREMPKGVVLAADTDVLRCYCEAVARYAQAARLYATSGLLVRRNGEIVKNPLHQITRDWSDAIRLFARELGLSPSARVGLHIDGGQGPTGFESAIGLPPRLRVVSDAS